jgi:hypothetical protein
MLHRSLTKRLSNKRPLEKQPVTGDEFVLGKVTIQGVVHSFRVKQAIDLLAKQEAVGFGPRIACADRVFNHVGFNHRTV